MIYINLLVVSLVNYYNSFKTVLYPMDNEDNLQQFTPFTHEEFYERYYVHRVAASSLVINSENKILIVKEIRKGKYRWGLPGGLLEKQESIIGGVVREVKEETNCEIKPFGMLGITNWAGKSIFESDTNTQSGFLIILASNYVSGTPTPDGVEVFETGFFSIDELDALHVHKSIKNFCKAVQEKSFIPLQLSEYQNSDAYRYIFSPFFSEKVV